MPRAPKPYPERGWFVSRPHGTYLRLCPVADGMTEARRRLKLELGRLEAEKELAGGRTVAAKLTVVELLVLFLEAVQTEKDADTFRDYQRWCTEFAKTYGSRPARGLTKADASDFKLALMRATYVVGNKPPRLYKPKTVNHALIALRRAFNWAVQTDRLPDGRNPFAGLPLLPCRGRTRVATEAEYHALLAGCTDDAFRDVLVAMRHTSARPQDIYSLTWDMVDWDARMWVLAEHKGSRTARDPKPRVIGMSGEVERVLRDRLGKHGPVGRVFLNADGRPWTKDALGLRMRRLRERVGVGADGNGEQFVLYTNRHTFLTAAGADPTISQSALAEIAGHTSPTTTARYVHAARAKVAEAGRRVGDGFTPPGRASAG